MIWTAQISARVGSLDLSVSLEGDAEPLLLIGPNGAGKTSLLRILAGAGSVQTGRIVVAGRILLDTNTGICLPPQDRRVGYVPQGYGLFPHLSAVDNVAFGLAGRDRAIADAMLSEVGCADLASQRPAHLSGGEKQRVALARALVTQPQLLLLDEPLAALDVGSRRHMRRFLASHLTGRPAVVVTHDARDVRALGGRVVVLEAGRVVQSGSVAEVEEAPIDEFVREFFN